MADKFQGQELWSILNLNYNSENLITFQVEKYL